MRFLCRLKNLRWMVFASLLAALAGVGAYIHIPIGPVPITLTTLFALLAGLLLGSRWGFMSMGLYVLVGAIGMPVFAGGRGGIAHLLGPTGGYLFGFMLAAWLTGFISERFRDLLAWQVLAIVAGSVAIYLLGIPWLKVFSQMTWTKSLMVGMVPFLAGDAVKAAAAVILARAIRPVLARQCPST